MSDHNNTPPKLSLGMAFYDDFYGVIDTLQSIRMYQNLPYRNGKVLDYCEFVLVDNHPHSKESPSTHSQEVRHLIHHLADADGWERYNCAQMEDVVGTSAPRDQVFRRAKGHFVLCMDSHVKFPQPDTLRRLLEWIDARDLVGDSTKSAPCQDIVCGPMVYDGLKTYSSHFDEIWREQMWGVWANAWSCGHCGHLMQTREIPDPANSGNKLVRWAALDNFDSKGLLRSQETKNCYGCMHQLSPPTLSWYGHEDALKALGHKLVVEDIDAAPFTVPGQGLGVFGCFRDAWLGFNPNFRGFGGEELYIHTKYRQAGHKCICLPFLRWWHRFGNPDRRSPPATPWNKVRNYIIGHTELGLPLQPIYDHFVAGGFVHEWEWKELRTNPANPPQDSTTGKVVRTLAAQGRATKIKKVVETVKCPTHGEHVRERYVAVPADEDDTPADVNTEVKSVDNQAVMAMRALENAVGAAVQAVPLTPKDPSRPRTPRVADPLPIPDSPYLPSHPFSEHVGTLLHNQEVTPSTIADKPTQPTLLIDEEPTMSALNGWVKYLSEGNHDFKGLEDYLIALSRDCDTVTELGGRRSSSTLLLLAGQPKTLRVIDPNPGGEWGALNAVRGKTTLESIPLRSEEVSPEPTDLLLIDTNHTGDQLSVELDMYANKVSRHIVIHDTVMFAVEGEGGGSGMVPAIENFLSKYPEWFVIKHFVVGSGLTVLSKDERDRPPSPISIRPEPPPLVVAGQPNVAGIADKLKKAQADKTAKEAAGTTSTRAAKTATAAAAAASSQQPTPRGTKAPDHGPGTKLKKLLASLGVNPSPNCDCNSKMATMNVWGVEGCRKNFNTIVGWLKDNQGNWGWSDRVKAMAKSVLTGLAFKLNPLDPFPGIVKEAIRLAEEESATEEQAKKQNQEPQQ